MIGSETQPDEEPRPQPDRQSAQQATAGLNASSENVQLGVLTTTNGGNITTQAVWKGCTVIGRNDPDITTQQRLAYLASQGCSPAPKHEIVLASPKVSRAHALLELSVLSSGLVTASLKDLGSTHKSYVVLGEHQVPLGSGEKTLLSVDRPIHFIQFADVRCTLQLYPPHQQQTPVSAQPLPQAAHTSQLPPLAGLQQASAAHVRPGYPPLPTVPMGHLVQHRFAIPAAAAAPHAGTGVAIPAAAAPHAATGAAHVVTGAAHAGNAALSQQQDVLACLDATDDDDDSVWDASVQGNSSLGTLPSNPASQDPNAATYAARPHGHPTHGHPAHTLGVSPLVSPSPPAAATIGGVSPQASGVHPSLSDGASPRPNGGQPPSSLTGASNTPVGSQEGSMQPAEQGPQLSPAAAVTSSGHLALGSQAVAGGSVAGSQSNAAVGGNQGGAAPVVGSQTGAVAVGRQTGAVAVGSQTGAVICGEPQPEEAAEPTPCKQVVTEALLAPEEVSLHAWPTDTDAQPPQVPNANSAGHMLAMTQAINPTLPLPAPTSLPAQAPEQPGPTDAAQHVQDTVQPCAGSGEGQLEARSAGEGEGPAHARKEQHASTAPPSSGGEQQQPNTSPVPAAGGWMSKRGRRKTGDAAAPGPTITTCIVTPDSTHHNQATTDSRCAATTDLQGPHTGMGRAGSRVPGLGPPESQDAPSFRPRSVLSLSKLLQSTTDSGAQGPSTRSPSPMSVVPLRVAPAGLPAAPHDSQQQKAAGQDHGVLLHSDHAADHHPSPTKHQPQPQPQAPCLSLSDLFRGRDKQATGLECKVAAPVGQPEGDSRQSGSQPCTSAHQATELPSGSGWQWPAPAADGGAVTPSLTGGRTLPQRQVQVRPLSLAEEIFGSVVCQPTAPLDEPCVEMTTDARQPAAQASPPAAGDDEQQPVQDPTHEPDTLVAAGDSAEVSAGTREACSAAVCEEQGAEAGGQGERGISANCQQPGVAVLQPVAGQHGSLGGVAMEQDDDVDDDDEVVPDSELQSQAYYPAQQQTARTHYHAQQQQQQRGAAHRVPALPPCSTVLGDTHQVQTATASGDCDMLGLQQAARLDALQDHVAVGRDQTSTAVLHTAIPPGATTVPQAAASPAAASAGAAADVADTPADITGGVGGAAAGGTAQPGRERRVRFSAAFGAGHGGLPVEVAATASAGGAEAVREQAQSPEHHDAEEEQQVKTEDEAGGSGGGDPEEDAVHVGSDSQFPGLMTQAAADALGALFVGSPAASTQAEGGALALVAMHADHDAKPAAARGRGRGRGRGAAGKAKQPAAGGARGGKRGIQKVAAPRGRGTGGGGRGRGGGRRSRSRTPSPSPELPNPPPPALEPLRRSTRRATTSRTPSPSPCAAPQAHDPAAHLHHHTAGPMPTLPETQALGIAPGVPVSHQAGGDTNGGLRKQQHASPDLHTAVVRKPRTQVSRPAADTSQLMLPFTPEHKRRGVMICPVVDLPLPVGLPDAEAAKQTAQVVPQGQEGWQGSLDQELAAHHLYHQHTQRDPPVDRQPEALAALVPPETEEGPLRPPELSGDLGPLDHRTQHAQTHEGPESRAEGASAAEGQQGQRQETGHAQPGLQESQRQDNQQQVAHNLQVAQHRHHSQLQHPSQGVMASAPAAAACIAQCRTAAGSTPTGTSLHGHADALHVAVNVQCGAATLAQSPVLAVEGALSAVGLAVCADTLTGAGGTRTVAADEQGSRQQDMPGDRGGLPVSSLTAVHGGHAEGAPDQEVGRGADISAHAWTGSKVPEQHTQMSGGPADLIVELPAEAGHRSGRSGEHRETPEMLTTASPPAQSAPMASPIAAVQDLPVSQGATCTRSRKRARAATADTLSTTPHPAASDGAGDGGVGEGVDAAGDVVPSTAATTTTTTKASKRQRRTTPRSAQATPVLPATPAEAPLGDTEALSGAAHVKDEVLPPTQPLAVTPPVAGRGAKRGGVEETVSASRKRGRQGSEGSAGAQRVSGRRTSAPVVVASAGPQEDNKSAAQQVRVQFSSQYDTKDKVKKKEFVRMVKGLGGTVVGDEEGVEAGVTHLLLPRAQFKRSMRQLLAIGCGAAVVNEKWLLESKERGAWVEVAPHHMGADTAAQKQWDFDLWASYTRRQRDGPVFRGMRVLITPALQKELNKVQVTRDVTKLEALKQLVPACGGVLLHSPADIAAAASASPQADLQGATEEPGAAGQRGASTGHKRRKGDSGSSVSALPATGSLVQGSGSGAAAGHAHSSDVVEPGQGGVLVVGCKDDDARRSGLPLGIKVWSYEVVFRSVLRSERLWAMEGQQPLFVTRRH